jgi:hypothetical protein
MHTDPELQRRLVAATRESFLVRNGEEPSIGLRGPGSLHQEQPQMYNQVLSAVVGSLSHLQLQDVRASQQPPQDASLSGQQRPQRSHGRIGPPPSAASSSRDTGHTQPAGSPYGDVGVSPEAMGPLLKSPGGTTYARGERTLKEFAAGPGTYKKFASGEQQKRPAEHSLSLNSVSQLERGTGYGRKIDKLNGWTREGSPRETLSLREIASQAGKAAAANRTPAQQRELSSRGGKVAAAKLTPEQQRELSSQGGKASAAKRRQRRDGDGAV